jgi:hypothetical protein
MALREHRGMPDEGGDPACWLSQVCEECGQLVERPREHHCAPDELVPAPGPEGVVRAAPPTTGDP